MFTGPLRSGSKSGTSVNCRKCRGSGIQVIHRPIGPGMVQQMRGPCTDCDGTGKPLGTSGHTISRHGADYIFMIMITIKMAFTA